MSMNGAHTNSKKAKNPAITHPLAKKGRTALTGAPLEDCGLSIEKKEKIKKHQKKKEKEKQERAGRLRRFLRDVRDLANIGDEWFDVDDTDTMDELEKVFKRQEGGDFTYVMKKMDKDRKGNWAADIVSRIGYMTPIPDEDGELCNVFEVLCDANHQLREYQIDIKEIKKTEKPAFFSSFLLETVKVLEDRYVDLEDRENTKREFESARLRDDDTDTQFQMSMDEEEYDEDDGLRGFVAECCYKVWAPNFKYGKDLWYFANSVAREMGQRDHQYKFVDPSQWDPESRVYKIMKEIFDDLKGGRLVELTDVFSKLSKEEESKKAADDSEDRESPEMIPLRQQPSSPVDDTPAYVPTDPKYIRCVTPNNETSKDMPGTPKKRKASERTDDRKRQKSEDNSPATSPVPTATLDDIPEFMQPPLRFSQKDYDSYIESCNNYRGSPRMWRAAVVDASLEDIKPPPKVVRQIAQSMEDIEKLHALQRYCREETGFGAEAMECETFTELYDKVLEGLLLGDEEELKRTVEMYVKKNKPIDIFEANAAKPSPPKIVDGKKNEAQQQLGTGCSSNDNGDGPTACLPAHLKVPLFHESDFEDYDIKERLVVIDNRIIKLAQAILDIKEFSLNKKTPEMYDIVIEQYDKSIELAQAYCDRFTTAAFPHNHVVHEALHQLGTGCSSNDNGDGPRTTKATKGTRMKSKNGVVRHEELDLYKDLVLARDAVKNSLQNIEDYKNKKNKNNKKQKKQTKKQQRVRTKKKYKMTAHNRAHVAAQDMANAWFGATIPGHKRALEWREKKADEWEDYCDNNKTILNSYGGGVLNAKQRLDALRRMGVGCVGYVHDAPKVRTFGKAYSSDYTGDGPKTIPTKSKDMSLRSGKKVLKGMCVKCVEFHGHPSFNGKCSVCYRGKKIFKGGIPFGKKCLDLYANMQLISQFDTIRDANSNDINLDIDVNTDRRGYGFIITTIASLEREGRVWKNIIGNKSYAITETNDLGYNLKNLYKSLLNKINTPEGYKKTVGFLKTYNKQGLKISAAMATRMMDEAFVGCTCRTHDQVTNFTNRRGQKQKIVHKNCGKCECATPVPRHEFCKQIFTHIIDPWNLLLEQDYNKKDVSQVKRPPYVLCYYAYGFGDKKGMYKHYNLHDMEKFRSNHPGLGLYQHEKFWNFFKHFPPSLKMNWTKLRNNVWQEYVDSIYRIPETERKVIFDSIGSVPFDVQKIPRNPQVNEALHQLGTGCSSNDNGDGPKRSADTSGDNNNNNNNKRANTNSVDKVPSGTIDLYRFGYYTNLRKVMSIRLPDPNAKSQVVIFDASQSMKYYKKAVALIYSEYCRTLLNRCPVNMRDEVEKKLKEAFPLCAATDDNTAFRHACETIGLDKYDVAMVVTDGRDNQQDIPMFEGQPDLHPGPLAKHLREKYPRVDFVYLCIGGGTSEIYKAVAEMPRSVVYKVDNELEPHHCRHIMDRVTKVSDRRNNADVTLFDVSNNINFMDDHSDHAIPLLTVDQLTELTGMIDGYTEILNNALTFDQIDKKIKEKESESESENNFDCNKALIEVLHFLVANKAFMSNAPISHADMKDKLHRFVIRFYCEGVLYAMKRSSPLIKINGKDCGIFVPAECWGRKGFILEMKKGEIFQKLGGNNFRKVLNSFANTISCGGVDMNYRKKIGSLGYATAKAIPKENPYMETLNGRAAFLIHRSPKWMENIEKMIEFVKDDTVCTIDPKAKKIFSGAA